MDDYHAGAHSLFFAGVDLIALVTGGGSKKSIADKVFGAMRFVLILLLATVLTVLFYLLATGWVNTAGR